LEELFAAVEEKPSETGTFPGGAEVRSTDNSRRLDDNLCLPGQRDPDEALSTLCGGQGVTIFFGMAKPVRPPQIVPGCAY